MYEINTIVLEKLENSPLYKYTMKKNSSKNMEEI